MNRDVCEHFNPVDLPCVKCKAKPGEPVAYSVGRTLHWHQGRGVTDAQLYIVPPQRPAEPAQDGCDHCNHPMYAAIKQAEGEGMKQMNHRFEHWYKLTHWMSPKLVRRDDDRYENEAVQAMYIAYRAGYNRATKDRKEELKEANT